MLLNLFQAGPVSAHPSGVELGIKDLSLQLALPQTIVSRLTATLVEYGYLYQNPTTRKYRLGLAAFTLGLAADPHLELNQAAKPQLEQLARQTRESVSLTVVDEVSGDGLCIVSLDSPSEIKLTTVVGSLRPLHRGATRKVLLAYLPQAQRQDYIRRLCLNSETQTVLLKELSDITEVGYAYSEEELDQGAFAVAAPVLTPNGVLLGGVAVLGPLFRHTEDERQSFIPLVRNAAAQIGKTFGNM